MKSFEHKILIVLCGALLFVQGCFYETDSNVISIATSTLIPQPKIPTLTMSPLPTNTITPTPVPLGIFAIIFYPPLILDYDYSVWEDESKYDDRNIIVNYLQVKEFTTCILWIQGPTGFYDVNESEDILLQNINYTKLTLPESFTPDFSSLYYLAKNSFSGYNGELYGWPVFGIGSIPSEWEKCKKLGEEVLSTLRVP
jgi:hypothetical protein